MLYEKLGRPALGKTISLVGKAAAEEIVQDVFVKLWKAGMKFPNLKSAYAWVYKCCTNSAIDFLRSRSNQSVALYSDSGAVIAEAESKADINSPSSLETQMAAKQSLHILVRELSQDEASFFIYRSVEGLKQDEIAEVMKISRRTVNRLQEKVDVKLAKLRGRQNVG
jgi:RNA polymerase sigma-70 factor (ECF subfamily)